MHDLYGLSDWVRSVADAFAAEGFVATEDAWPRTLAFLREHLGS